MPPRPTPTLIVLHPLDSVGVVTGTVLPGQTLASPSSAAPLTVRDKIPALHKVARVDLPDGSPIRKYGQIIGFARGNIPAGSHVHTYNVTLGTFDRDYAIGTEATPLPPLAADDAPRTFLGFPRPGGQAGTRNYLAVISTVNCSASVSRYVAERFRGPEFRRKFPHVDGVIALTHKSGCAMAPDEPTRLLQRVLAGMARHPNITGYVLVGLGCEVNQTTDLLRNESLSLDSPEAQVTRVLNIQAVGGVQRTVDAASQAMTRLLPEAEARRRVPVPISALTLALNCGGSDGASGITANPALGVAADWLVRHGGTAVLAETPEIYGAEHLLTRRAVRREVGEHLLARIRWWEDHARQHGASIDNNPSVGNKEGGLTTIYEKSLGAVAKGGQAPLGAVYQYAERIRERGFAFMDTPGYDPVSMTGLVAGGCNVAVFTTGRGSVYGCKPTPCLKVSTNTPLYEWMRDDIDLDAGTILDGLESIETVGRRIFEEILATASGAPTKSEAMGLGDEEFAPWILGPVF